MPSSVAHASIAILLAPMLRRGVISARLLALTALCAALPDIDAIGRPFGHGDIALLGGHRAVTHSLFFAIAAGVLVAALHRRRAGGALSWRIGLYATVVVLSHGLLDMLTTYGEGVAFLAPLSMQRWKSPWQPFSGILPEVLALWLPALVLYQLWLSPRTRGRASSPDAT